MVTITNKQSITTTADHADIFVLTDSDISFINRGDLSTSGAEASAIVIDADDVTVRNFGNLAASGDNTPVIVAGERDDPISGARIYNHGAIQGTNLGILLSSFGGGGDNLIENSGSIETSAEIRSQGIAVSDDNAIVINRGTILADSEIADGIVLVGTGNHGENHGTISVSGEASDGVSLVGADQTFINRGTIDATGFDTAGVRLQGLDIGQQAASGTLTNLGTIRGELSVAGAASDDTVVNRGSLIGDVQLFSGDDTFVAGKGGTLDGTLSLGLGDDLIVLERNAGLLEVDDFTSGVGSDDVIDLRALRIDSLDELFSHASESGGTVTLDFGSSAVALHNVTLASLSADDFLFDQPGAAGINATAIAGDLAYSLLIF